MADTERSHQTRVTLAHFIDGTASLPLDRAMLLVRASALALDRFQARQPVHGALCPHQFEVHGDDAVIVAAPGVDAAADEAQYRSPQQRAGQPSRPADDIYALGVIIGEMLAAADAPPDAPGTGMDRQQRQRTLVEDQVRALTSWSLAERPATGAEVVQALDRADTAPHTSAEAPWVTAERVSQARHAYLLAQSTPPRPPRTVRPPRVRAPLTKGHHPDLQLPLPWVAAIVVVLCSVYLLPLYLMVFPAG
jgi:hypothetical protein